ncbi:MAG: 2-amino-4-hydroxy-6-hydroxymethyldihydropteridine diphosphokinase [Xanthomonadales bacterium]|nr:hypothetical protein [Xanthomonadales bacterium]MCC6593820.1 2-amino-4-hydroxy-6-hydroxymethyldihydropteridine diphosphokinase [Xanthomonadales bacterium]
MRIATTTESAATGSPRIVLLLGSNVDADAQLDRALALLAQEFGLLAVSARLRSAATCPGAPDYANQAALLRCALDHAALKPRLRRIESALGRQRPAADPRLCPIDIDAVGRYAPDFELWDTDAHAAAYAWPVLAELGVPGRSGKE